MRAPANPDPALAAAVRQLREARSMTQEDLAHEAHLTTSALARIEREEANPTWGTVRRIAAGLGVSMRELGEAIDRGP